MSPERLKYFKSLLLEEKNRILVESSNANRVDEALIKEIMRGDIYDHTSARLEYEKMQNMSDNQRTTLNLIDKALVKIERGSYGICEGTGNAIDEERLEAIPYTPYSLEYAVNRKSRNLPPHKRHKIH